MEDQFINDCTDFLKHKNKNIKITKTKLVKEYPEVFEFTKNKRGLVIKESENKNEWLDVLKKYYIPYLIKDGNYKIHTTKSEYISKDGKVKTYDITTLNKCKISKFNVLDESDEVKKILNDEDLPTPIKIDMIYNLEINNFGISQINNYVYRRLNDMKHNGRTNKRKTHSDFESIENKSVNATSTSNQSKKKLIQY